MRAEEPRERGGGSVPAKDAANAVRPRHGAARRQEQLEPSFGATAEDLAGPEGRARPALEEPRQSHAVEPSDRAVAARPEAGEYRAVSHGQSLQCSGADERSAEDLRGEVREADRREVEGRSGRWRRARRHERESIARATHDARRLLDEVDGETIGAGRHEVVSSVDLRCAQLNEDFAIPCVGNGVEVVRTPQTLKPIVRTWRD